MTDSRWCKGMVGFLAIAALSGCGTVSEALKPGGYEPWHGAVSDKVAYHEALQGCQASARDFIARGEFSPKRVAIQGARGGVAAGPAAAAAGGIVAAIGALSSLGTESLDELVGSQGDTNRITAQCMRDRGHDTGKWSTWDPWLSH